jgi:hypothetical protein
MGGHLVVVGRAGLWLRRSIREGISHIDTNAP